MVFVVGLFHWDYRCDCDRLETVLAVYDTLALAVEFSETRAYAGDDYAGDYCIEIFEMESDKLLTTYDEHGNILEKGNVRTRVCEPPTP